MSYDTRFKLACAKQEWLERAHAVAARGWGQEEPGPPHSFVNKYFVLSRMGCKSVSARKFECGVLKFLIIYKFEGCNGLRASVYHAFGPSSIPAPTGIAHLRSLALSIQSLLQTQTCCKI